ncbi:hypothetical protein [Streptomyces javensis]|uniref:hypothetical protein n=1 Tax=Streptomyces javensis TaxID=114698 RepID=UPI001FE26C26|nr:hypothetical protein [Streptomyces javensis]
MDAGHSAEDAVVFAGRFPSWQNADPEALATFGAAVAALWREIAEESPTPWKQQMAKQAAVLALALALGGGSQAYLGPRISTTASGMVASTMAPPIAAPCPAPRNRLGLAGWLAGWLDEREHNDPLPSGPPRGHPLRTSNVSEHCRTPACCH